MSLYSELKRRNVFRVAAAYAVVAWLLIQVADTTFPLFGFGDTPARIVVILLIIGFVPALIFAWAFELTPSGLQKDENVDRSLTVTTIAAKRLDRIIMLVLVLALSFFAFDKFVLSQSREKAIAESARQEGLSEALLVIKTDKSIAVLPFANASENSDDLYMSEGLGDELRDQLGRIDGLRVAARSSSVIFRNQTVDAMEISDRLSVGRLIEGTLRRQGDQLRITVQIIDGETGFQIWTQSYDRPAVDLLAIQQEIAMEVVMQVMPVSEVALIESEPATLNASAHDLMLLARHYYQQVKDDPVVDLELLLKAIDLYRQATIVDPESALAQSRLGAALLYLGDVEQAEGPIFKALTIDRDLSEVQYTLGLFYWSRHLPGSGPAYERAIKLNQNNVDALQAYGLWIWAQGDTDGAEPYLRRALELDPMSISRYLELGNFYGLSGLRDKAIALVQQIPARFNDSAAFLAAARIYETTGDLDEGIGWALKARMLQPDYVPANWMLGELYARIGDFEAARYFDPDPAMYLLYFERSYEEVIELGEDLVFENPNQTLVWYLLARAYIATGKFQQAVYVLQTQGLPDNVLVDSRRTNAIEALVILADALKEAGETERAHELARWLEPFYKGLLQTGGGTSWYTNLYLSCSLSILDNDEESLDVLERIMDTPGLAWYPVVRDAPCFQKFVDEPRYHAIVTSLENRKAVLRDRLPDTLARFHSVQ